MNIFAEKLLTEQGFLSDQLVVIENGRICGIMPARAEEADMRVCILTPGLFDKHEHGAMGFDATYPEDEKCRMWLQLLAAHGVTNVLYTLGTGPVERTSKAVEYCASLMRAQANGLFPGARVEGVHLEGPFISEIRSGAMAKEYILAPSIENYHALCGGHEEIIRAITIAPEVDGAAETSRALSAMGIKVQAGHTDATCAEAQKAFREDGFTGITHFYNAARPLMQREPGVLGAALVEDSVTCEAICDLVHVAPEMLKVLVHMKGPERVAVISDSVSTAGLPDGEYFGGNHSVIVKDGKNYTRSGGIAGGGVQADAGVRNLLDMGFRPEEVFRMASTTPAEYLGIEGLGAIKEGYRACLAAWDSNYTCVFSIVDGVLAGN